MPFLGAMRGMANTGGRSMASMGPSRGIGPSQNLMNRPQQYQQYTNNSNPGMPMSAIRPMNPMQQMQRNQQNQFSGMQGPSRMRPPSMMGQMGQGMGQMYDRMTPQNNGMGSWDPSPPDNQTRAPRMPQVTETPGFNDFYQQQMDQGQDFPGAMDAWAAHKQQNGIGPSNRFGGGGFREMMQRMQMMPSSNDR